jgi:signal peptidase II
MLQTIKDKLYKYRFPLLTVFLVLLIDQSIKLYIKTHYFLQEEHAVAGDWFILHFTENPGMAFGMQMGGSYGKLMLSIFRILASVFGVYYIIKIVRQKMHTGYIICVAMILAGAVGNIIDSMFYGLIFDKGMVLDPETQQYVQYYGLAEFSSQGYSSFLHGCVVDMFYFPIVSGTFPDWMPIWGGEDFEFFRPVFNFADASISVGVVIILLFQKRFFRHGEKKKEEEQQQQPAA